jgi:methyl-accepting chemotaxis protein
MARGLQRLVPSVIRRSYAVKFGISLMIIGLLVAGVGFFATKMVEAEIQEDVDDEFATVATQEAESVEAWDERNQQFTKTIARTARLDELEAADLQGYENQERRTHSVHVIDVGNGTVVATSSSIDRGASLSSDTAVPETERLLTRLQTGDSSGEFGIVRSGSYTASTDDQVPVISYLTGSENGLGVMVTVRLAPQGAEIYSDSARSGDDRTKDRTTIVLDGEDRVLLDDVAFGQAGGNFQAIYDGPLPDPEGAQSGAKRYEAAGMPRLLTSSYDRPKEDYIVGYSRVDVEGADWIVLTYATQRRADGFVNAVGEYGQYATILGVLLITGLGAIIGRNTARSIDRLTETAARMEDGDLGEEFETSRIDNIGRLYDGFASMRDALKTQINEAEEARAEAERERNRIEEINEDLTRTAEEYCRVMGSAADGDLTVRATIDTENDQMATVGEEFNAMLADIEATIHRLSLFATQVATSSEEVTASSQEVRSASQQVSESIQHISAGAKRQNEALESASREIDDLSTTTQQIAASSNQVADLAEGTAKTGLDAREAAQSAIAGMVEIETESEQAVEEIRRLEQEVAQIDELIASIAEIAEQTNMLALNANIEASRAQENAEGEGFGVVAQEVKELSGDVKDAAEEIENRLEAIDEQTERTADQVESTSQIVGDASAYVEEAVDALEQIAQYAKQTNDGVQEISAATKQQAASMQEVGSVVEEVTDISAETTEEAQNVAAAAQEQTSALSEVSESAQSLAEHAAELSEALDRFETDTEVDHQDQTVFGPEAGPGSSEDEPPEIHSVEFDESDGS